jgi:hypothetical protein
VHFLLEIQVVITHNGGKKRQKVELGPFLQFFLGPLSQEREGGMSGSL